MLAARSRPARLGAIVAVVVLVAVGLGAGLPLRRALWRATASARFEHDVRNAVHWGSAADRRGLLDLYDQQVAEHPDGRYGLDYPPLRLTLVAAWMRWNRARLDDGGAWRNTWAYHRPMLWLNAAAELAALPAVFLLVRRFPRRRPGAGPAARWRAPATGVAAAALLWFDPAVLTEAYGWPQWDVWLVPCFLWALLALLADLPLAAGLLIGIAAMAKGQILLVTPLLVLWPLLAGRWRAAWALIAGVAGGILLAALPFQLQRSTAAWLWLGGVTLATLLAPPLRAALRERRVPPAGRALAHTAVAVAVAAAAAWPLAAGPARSRFWPLLAAVVALALAILFCPRRSAAGRVTVLVVAILLTVPLFGASLAWWRVGVAYPTHHYHVLAMGAAHNLPSVLGRRYGWGIDDPALSIGAFALSLGGLLRTLYALTLVPLAWAAGRWARAFDPRFFFAVVAPWVLAFDVLPQMHERYLLWAAATSVLWVADGLAGLALHLVVAAQAWVMVALPLATKGGPPQLTAGLHRVTAPEVTLALLLVPLLLLVLALAPRRPWRSGLAAPGGAPPEPADRGRAGGAASGLLPRIWNGLRKVGGQLRPGR